MLAFFSYVYEKQNMNTKIPRFRCKAGAEEFIVHSKIA